VHNQTGMTIYNNVLVLGCHNLQPIVCFKKVANLKRLGIFSLQLSFLREILQICWQFTSTYIYQFL